MTIGFVIWGLRYNDFSSDLLSSGLVRDVKSVLGDQLRQVCATQLRPFLYVERSADHVLVTIFKPDALDHVGRRAYIGITVFVPTGYQLKSRKGSVPEAMRQLLAYYEEKQGRVVERNMFTASMFQAQVDDLLYAERHSNQRTHGSKRGYAVYTQHLEETWFEEMPLGDFKRVFFFREQPDLQAAGLGVYEPFDPTPKKEVIRPIEPRPGNGKRTHRRRPKWSKRTAWIMATVIGLSLLVLGGGTWWALDRGSTPTIPVQTPTVTDTTTSRARSILERSDTGGADSLEDKSAAADQPKKTEADSGAKAELESKKVGPGSRKEQQQEPANSTSSECKKWCAREREKSKMDDEQLKAHDKAKPEDCTCPTK